MNFNMAQLFENDTIIKLVNFGKWLCRLKMIIGFPKAVTIV